MRERPILFSAPMVRANLADQKTQTRRVVGSRILSLVGEPDGWEVKSPGVWRAWCHHTNQVETFTSPYGVPGDRLWVRETWCRWYGGQRFEGDIANGAMSAGTHGVAYCADFAGGLSPFRKVVTEKQWSSIKGHSVLAGYEQSHARWRPSIHMPRWASRLSLDIVSVRVERLQDISEEDARAEGCSGGHDSIPGYAFSATPREHFRHLWGSINGAESWDANPWVWVISFKRTEVQS